MAVTALALPGATYSAQGWRQAVIGGFYAHAANSITVVPGVVVGMAVTGLVGAQAQIATGICVVSPADGTRGSYQVSSDATVVLNLAAPDATYSRIDAISVRVRDAAFGDAATDAAVVATTGTASVSPVAPSVPTGHLLLAHVTVPPNGQAAATDQRLYTSAIGGAMAGTRAQRLALSTSFLRPGQTFTENTDSPAATPPGKTGQTWQWNGTQWTPQFICGWRGYIGIVQRNFNWGYEFDIPAGRVQALAVRKTTGVGWDERNNLDCTIINGFNVQVPYAGRYRITASVATDSATANAEYVLGIHQNLAASTADQGVINAVLPGLLLDEQPKYMQIVAANASHTVHTVEVPHYGLAANDTITVRMWQNSGALQRIRWENPYTAFLDITRLGD